MSMSNIEYSVFKKRKGLHNWGFMSSKDDLDSEITTTSINEYPQQDLLHQNSYGEYFALQDLEE